MRYFIVTYIIVILITVSIMGTRGDFSKNTPLEVFPDMDRQAKFKTQTFTTSSFLTLWQTDYPLLELHPEVVLTI